MVEERDWATPLKKRGKVCSSHGKIHHRRGLRHAERARRAGQRPHRPGAGRRRLRISARRHGRAAPLRGQARHGLGAAAPAGLSRRARPHHPGGAAQERRLRGRCHRHRHGLYGLHAPPHQARRHAAVLPAGIRARAARLRQALEAPRRAGQGQPPQRDRRGPRRGLAAKLRRKDQQRVGHPQDLAGAGRGAGDLRGGGPLHRGGGLDHLAALRPGDAQQLHRRLQGDLEQADRLPEPGLLQGPGPPPGNRRAGQARHGHHAPGQPRGQPYGAGRRAHGPAPRHRGRRGQRGRARLRSGGGHRRPGQDAGHHGHLHLPHHDGGGGKAGARHVRRRGGRRPARLLRLRSRPELRGRSLRLVRGELRARRLRAGGRGPGQEHPRLPHREGGKTPARPERPARAGLVERQPLGAGGCGPDGHDAGHDAGDPPGGDVPRADRGHGLRHARDHRELPRKRRAGGGVLRLRRHLPEERHGHADLRGRAQHAHQDRGLGAGPGPGQRDLRLRRGGRGRRRL